MKSINYVVILLCVVFSFGAGSQSKPSLQIDQEDRVVGICYSTWFNPIVKSGTPIFSMTEIVTDNPKNPQWGPEHAFHYWAEPALGYYRSDDRHVIQKHFDLFTEAKIDFIVLDNTNMLLSWPQAYIDEMVYKPYQVIFEEALKRRNANQYVPAIVIWCKAEVINDMVERYYHQDKYKSLFAYWDEGAGSKPLILITDQVPDEYNDEFSMRKMWGLQPSLAEKEWSFLQTYPQKPSLNADKIEQLTVSPAQQETYMTKPTAHGRANGQNFNQQWQRVFDLEPHIVVITWWNEWIAQRFILDGETHFVDAYTAEFSRCIEPMRDGHGDQYYQLMKRYIEEYKNVKH